MAINIRPKGQAAPAVPEPFVPGVGVQNRAATAESFGAGLARGLGSVASAFDKYAKDQQAADDSDAAVRFATWKGEMRERLQQEVDSADPNLSNLGRRLDAMVAGGEDEFLRSLTDDQRSRFAPRIKEAATGFRTNALTADRKHKVRFFKNKTLELIRAEGLSIASTENPQAAFDEALGRIGDQLNLQSTVLGRAEQATLIQTATLELSKEGYRAVFGKELKRGEGYLRKTRTNLFELSGGRLGVPKGN